MTEQQQDLNYVRQVLGASEQGNSYPAIYALWGCIVLLGHVLMEFNIHSGSLYWFIAGPIGMVISAWLGIRADHKKGQHDSETGDKYMIHFAIMLGAIFIAMFTKQYESILLLISLGYALAGLHLERLMYAVGALTALLYIAVCFGLITSHLIVGIVLAIGFFALSWSAAKMNKHSIANA